MIVERRRILKVNTKISSAFCWKAISRLQHRAGDTQTRYILKKSKKECEIWDLWAENQKGRKYSEKELQKSS